MYDLNEHTMSVSGGFLPEDVALADKSSMVPYDDAGLPLDTDEWICTCGHENEGTDRCEACDEFLHERDWYWNSFAS